MITSPSPRRLPALPRTVAPLHRESWDSYLKRLARANRIPFMLLHEHLNDPDRIPPEPLPLLDAICDLSGQPRDRLLRALPDLRPPGGPDDSEPIASLRLSRSGWKHQAACTNCVAARGVLEPAWHWVIASTKLCLRHSRWTDDRAGQFDLHRVPDVVHAQRRHHRLARRHGWAAVTLAMREATDLGWGWWENDQFEKGWRQRMAALTGPNWAGYDNDPKIIASVYPEIVALTGLLVSPVLRELPFTGKDADMRRFIAEVRARAVPDYQYDTTVTNDPLVQWVIRENIRRALPDPMPEGA